MYVNVSINTPMPPTIRPVSLSGRDLGDVAIDFSTGTAYLSAAEARDVIRQMNDVLTALDFGAYPPGTKVRRPGTSEILTVRGWMNGGGDRPTLISFREVDVLYPAEALEVVQ